MRCILSPFFRRAPFIVTLCLHHRSDDYWQNFSRSSHIWNESFSNDCLSLVAFVALESLSRSNIAAATVGGSIPVEGIPEKRSEPPLSTNRRTGDRTSTSDSALWWSPNVFLAAQVLTPLSEGECDVSSRFFSVRPLFFCARLPTPLQQGYRFD
jgi:hypothetical protein